VKYGFFCYTSPFTAQRSAFVIALRVSKAQVYFVVVLTDQALSPEVSRKAKLYGFYSVPYLLPSFALQVQS